MSISATDISNLALQLVRGNLKLNNLNTDTSAAAKLLQVVYPLKQAELLRARPWTFTKAQATLVPLATNPNPVWAFSYTPPTDMLYPRRILGVTQNILLSQAFSPIGNIITDVGTLYAPQTDNNNSIVRFEMMEGVLFTNMPNAILEYSQNVLTESSYPPKFVWALAYAVAAEIAPSLSAGDPFQMAPKLASESKRRFDECAAEEGNQKVWFTPDAEVIRARGGSW